MKTLLVPILFALGTALCWGLYGSALGNARSTAKPPEWSPFKPYVFIGVAYLVIAIIGGLIAMKVKGDNFSYTGIYSATRNWGFIAGSLGAIGALCLTTAIVESKGNTALVMPIVFGGAVTVNGLFAWYMLRSNPDIIIRPALWGGMVLVGVGVIIVAIYTPHGPPKKTATTKVDAAKMEPADDANSPSATSKTDSTPGA